jgi:hypothetical protein
LSYCDRIFIAPCIISITKEITIQKLITDLKEVNFLKITGIKKPIGMNNIIFPITCLKKMPNPKMNISFTVLKGIRLKVNLKSGNGKSYLIGKMTISNKNTK